jgi:hypothetical protein
MAGVAVISVWADVKPSPAMRGKAASAAGDDHQKMKKDDEKKTGGQETREVRSLHLSDCRPQEINPVAPQSNSPKD